MTVNCQLCEENRRRVKNKTTLAHTKTIVNGQNKMHNRLKRMFISVGQYKICTAFLDGSFHFCIYIYISLYSRLLHIIVHSWVGWWVLVYFTGMNVSGAVNTHFCDEIFMCHM